MVTDSTDSEDEILIKKLLDATDTTLLKDSLFQTNIENNGKFQKKVKELYKSQRYLPENEKKSSKDIIIPDSVQKHMAKKLSEILTQKYEFFQIEEDVQPALMRKSNNCLKLLSDANCYVNSYEDCNVDINRPSKRPIIRSQVNQVICTEEMYKSLAVDASYILNGSDNKYWNKRKERPNKIFHYKMGKNGVLHAKEQINEFTKLRHRNQWHESKIRDVHFRKLKNKK